MSGLHAAALSCSRVNSWYVTVTQDSLGPSFLAFEKKNPSLASDVIRRGSGSHFARQVKGGIIAVWMRVTFDFPKRQRAFRLRLGAG